MSKQPSDTSVSALEAMFKSAPRLGQAVDSTRAPSTYTPAEITEMCDTWHGFNGFSGETCGKCHRTANVFAFGPGWFCGCGHYNIQSWSHAKIPHDQPDFGPRACVIRAGIGASQRWQALVGSAS